MASTARATNGGSPRHDKKTAPAKTTAIELFEKEKRAKVFVQPDQRPLAIGKQGQNVRLASILTGWEIDILDISEFKGAVTVAKQEEKIVSKNVEDLGLSEALVQALKTANLTIVEQLKGLSAKDLVGVEGIDAQGALEVEKAVKRVK